MKKRVLVSMIVLGVLFSSIVVQAAGGETCNHTNINSFDSKPSTDHYFHFLNNNEVCHITVTKYFTTYSCLDCGTIVDIIDHENIVHSKQHN